MLLTDNALLSGTVQGFGFSGVRPELLDSSEYTLVTLLTDKTSSVASFADQLFQMNERVVGACRKSPRSDFLLLRVLEFNTAVDEVHGFKPLSAINTKDYQVPKCCGMTALRDGVFSAVAGMNAYAKTLVDQDYLVNGIVVVVTDGDDNRSRMSAAQVKKEIQKATGGEVLESLRTVLVAVNAGQYTRELQEFRQEVGIDQYVEVKDASESQLAKLFDFISRSVSSQSVSLGTGGPSQALVF